MSQLSLLDPPVQADAAQSSIDAAARVKPKLGTQLDKVLTVVRDHSPTGVSNREIQLIVCGGHNPGHPAWNKIPTRCRTLERQRLIALVVDDDGSPALREHPSGGRFLTWRAL